MTNVLCVKSGGSTADGGRATGPRRAGSYLTFVTTLTLIYGMTPAERAKTEGHHALSSR